MDLSRWAGVLLGVVFVVAGAAKLASGASWPAQAAQLGAPRRVAPVVPWFELAVGALLVTGVLAPWIAVVAVATLVVFTLAIVRVLRTGARPVCACFGAWSATPVGWRSIARNAVFVAIGVVAIVA